jgi:CMP-N-acetylneuraminic acid synthetase
MKTLAIIPARMGSARIPRKNLCQVAGRSLVQHSVDCARDCGQVAEIVISSDEDLAIPGARLHRRPEHLSGPLTDIADVIADVLQADWSCDLVAVLQPAVMARSPLILAEMIRTISAISSPIWNWSAITMARALPWIWSLEAERATTAWGSGPYPRSQDSGPRFQEVNAITIVPAELARAGRRWSLPLMIAELPPWAASLDIDEPADLDRVRSMWPWAQPQLETWKPTFHAVRQLAQGAA